jgi:HAMP domain-containing protein
VLRAPTEAARMSFSRLTVRTRIACILLPLVAVILALATLEVRERLDRSRTAAAQSEVVEVVAAVTDLAATHAQLALAAVDGIGAAAQPAADDARARLTTLLEGSAGEAPLVVASAAEVGSALVRFDQAVEAAERRPGALAVATRELLAIAEVTAGAAASEVDAGGADLEPALVRLQAHDAATVLGLELSAGDETAIVAAAERLDAAVARAEVVERGSPVAVTAALRSGALAPEEVDRVAGGGEPAEGSAVEVAEQVALVAAAAAAEVPVQLQAVEDARADARRDALTFAIGTAAALLVALGVALLVTRSITAPLRELTESIDEVTTRRLPRLVDRLRSPDDTGGIADELTPVPVRSDDEIGRLAASFNALQQVTGEVAEQQAALLRTGISDLFVNLARRNQALIERQLRFIDELEAREEDPERLRNLFELDHLATRMRRNAESLLVIAGSTPGRRQGAPVPMPDVVRIAAGEIEQYQRVVAVGVEDVPVRSTVAADLAHLLAELLDNATAFSAPGTSVEVMGQQIGDTYLVVVTDRGDGIPPRRLAELNATLLRPPAVGLDLARTLGMTVIARLAHRHGIAVRLVAGEDEGLVAQVLLPAAVLAAAPVLPPAVVGPDRVVTAPPPPAPLPSTVPASALVGAAAVRTTADDRTVTPDQLGFLPGSGYQPVPVAGRLPVRPLPQPGEEAVAAPKSPVDGPRRSPDEVRRTLARYRSGLARGRAEGGSERAGVDGSASIDRAVNQ